MHPVLLPGFGVEAMEEATEVGDVHQAVYDGGRRDRPSDLVEVPDAAALGDVSSLGCVDRIEMSDAFTMLGVLAVGDVDAVLIDHRRGDDLIACLRPDRVLRVGVEFPELL